MPFSRSSRARSVADGIGILGSAACAIHCVATPLLLVAGAALPAWVGSDESFHRAMLWLVVPASTLAFGLGCRRHRDRWVLVLGVLGLLGLTLGAMAAHTLMGDHAEQGERVVTLVSAALLIAAHVRNVRGCRADASADARANRVGHTTTRTSTQVF